MQDAKDWAALFHLCTSEAKQITDVHLDSLFGNGIILFEPPFRLPHSDERLESCLPGLRARWKRLQSTVTAQGGQEEEPPGRIKYRLLEKSSQKLSPVRAWEQDLTNSSGPPGYGAEACLMDCLPPAEIWRLMP